jgi:hypothetical protein
MSINNASNSAFCSGILLTQRWRKSWLIVCFLIWVLRTMKCCMLQFGPVTERWVEFDDLY